MSPFFLSLARWASSALQDLGGAVGGALDSVAGWLGAGYYAQHSICLLGDPVIISLMLASNEGIALSYYIIGGTLLWTFAFERRVAISLNGKSGLLFAAFIFLCGMTHTVMDITIFSGVYRLDVLIRMLTFGVSAVTAAKVVTDKLDSRAAVR